MWLGNLLIDDGPADEREVLVDSFMKKDQVYLKLSSSECRSVFARRVGINKVKGEYFLFQDSDDVFTNDCLENVDVFLRRQPADVAMLTAKLSSTDGISLWQRKNSSC